MKLLEDFLTEIADAIRKRKAKSGLIEAQQFAEEIESIPQEITGNFQEKVVSITASGNTEVTPDSDYDGLSKVTVSPKLQSKTSSLTSASSTTITPDSGYAGLSSVSVTPAVQTKSQTITSNGTTTITPDSGKVGLSSVSITTNVSGGKLGGSFQYNYYNTSELNNDQTYNITIPANKQYAIIVFVINSQNNTPKGTLEVTSKPSNITLSAIGSSNGHRKNGNINVTTYCYLATKTSSISSAATITFKNDWDDTNNGYGNAGCSYGVFYNV